MRPYTPISTADARGFFELLIKIYEKGKLTQYLSRLQIGQSIEVKGPTGRFHYQPNMRKCLAMIAGGTGITPMYQVLQAIASNPDDATRVILLYGNISEEDVLLRHELEALCARCPQFTVHHVLERPSVEWRGPRGFVTEDLIAQHFPVPSEEMDVLLCGPPGMISAMRSHLTKLGFADTSVFKF
jgi:cytochrome-b5 reductase